MPLFSVIMPCYNSEKYIRVALDSVFAQTFTDFEVIVVDDGSTDRSLAMLEEYGNRITLLSQKNSGAGTARNLGIKMARGEYLAFLDADDCFFPWALQVMAEAIHETKAEIVAGHAVRFNEDDLPTPAQHSAKPRLDVYAHPLAAYRLCGFRLYLPSAMTLRRDAVNSVGGYVEGRINGEDTDLILKLGTADQCCIIHEPPLAAYRRHDTNSTLSALRGYEGTLFQVRQEKRGAYPGSGVDRLSRLEILTSHSRAGSILCARPGYWRQGWHIYFLTFSFNLALFRFKYLLCFPVLGSYWMVKTLLKQAVSVLCQTDKSNQADSGLQK